MRHTPENIISVGPNQVFVFGSNEGGRHGKGAARQALTWGAVYGQAEGLQGRTYGIPSKDSAIRRTLTLDQMKPYVDRFVEFARSRPDLTFLVTEIGCGLAGLRPKQVGPLFEGAKELNNVYLPKRFARLL